MNISIKPPQTICQTDVAINAALNFFNHADECQIYILLVELDRFTKTRDAGAAIITAARRVGFVLNWQDGLPRTPLQQAARFLFLTGSETRLSP